MWWLTRFGEWEGLVGRRMLTAHGELDYTSRYSYATTVYGSEDSVPQTRISSGSKSEPWPWETGIGDLGRCPGYFCLLYGGPALVTIWPFMERYATGPRPIAHIPVVPARRSW